MDSPRSSSALSPPLGRLLTGVAGTTATLIVLQVLLFRMLTIFGDYLSAHAAISVALLGLALGGLVAFAAGEGRAATRAQLAAALLLPGCVLLAFAIPVALADQPLGAALLLMAPFLCGSVVITVALVQARSHLVYCADLVGAAVGALLVNPALVQFREEGSFFALTAASLVVAGCFVGVFRSGWAQRGLLLVVVAGAVFCGSLTWFNRELDVFNVVRTKLEQTYPAVQMIASRSCLVGRYDVVRRKPNQSWLSTYENGRVTDTIRNWPKAWYRLDPRVPPTLMVRPRILILGVSGDGVTKTCRRITNEVDGVEINPVIVALQTGELTRFNGRSYHGLQLHVTDARSFVESSRKRYDLITLMNAHLARGRTSGRAPSPEYLDTVEAVGAYLDHLTDRGLLIVEEPVSRPRREPPVWKLVRTMREALVRRGARDPAHHFFIFQWRTHTNNYIQILLKKQPFTREELKRLDRWLADVEAIPRLEARTHRRWGPIRCKIIVLHRPHRGSDTNYTRIVAGRLPASVTSLCNLALTTDDRPFHFDVEPGHPHMKRAYGRTLLLAFLVLAAALWLAPPTRRLTGVTTPALIVTTTGLAYLLAEVVLMQRYQLYLGSPVVSFITVLGTLLLCSGLGSLASGRAGSRGAAAAALGAAGWLALSTVFFKTLFSAAAASAVPARIVLTTVTVAPLGFFLGVPFPFVLRTGKRRLTPPTAAFLFALNAVGGALAVPLALNVTATWGLTFTLRLAAGLYVLAALLLAAWSRRALQPPVNAIAALVLGLLLVAPWLPRTPPTGERLLNRNQYQVYGVSYGYSHRAENRVFVGGSPHERVGFDWLFWVARGRGRTLLVDTGFGDRRRALRWRHLRFTPPLEQLQQLGLSSKQVTDVILTHGHWDHVGLVGVYRNARVWLQRREYEWMKSVVTPAAPEAHGVRFSDVQTLQRIEREGRLRLVAGETTVFPGVTLTWAGGHTPGSQFVTVESAAGPVVIAGDLCPNYGNVFKHIAVPDCVSRIQEEAALRELPRRAASPFYVLPGHGPRVRKWFPEVGGNIVEISPLGE